MNPQDRGTNLTFLRFIGLFFLKLSHSILLMGPNIKIFQQKLFEMRHAGPLTLNQVLRLRDGLPVADFRNIDPPLMVYQAFNHCKYQVVLSLN